MSYMTLWPRLVLPVERTPGTPCGRLQAQQMGNPPANVSRAPWSMASPVVQPSMSVKPPFSPRGACLCRRCDPRSTRPSPRTALLSAFSVVQDGSVTDERHSGATTTNSRSRQWPKTWLPWRRLSPMGTRTSTSQAAARRASRLAATISFQDR